ncbi:serine/threonine-protein kinase [Streptomyces sp. NPDC089919]|uniref:serine/threonine-protein kinase n=1 Tax=Streptomyces sp. NPDC089919 TaxID=3155188 RepID=UPI00343730D8
MPRSAQPAHPAQPEYAGQYRLESVLGSGGMGVVHLATSASGLRLAVKVVHAEFAADPEFRARFRQEVTAARRVSGAFTAAVVDADPDAERPWMATLFVDGPTLSERVKRNPLETHELNRLGAGLAEALRDIHRAGLVHRDLKPSNVLMAGDGPKVIDFGISRPYDSDLRTETGKLIGTPPFMAPEQFQRPREVGPEADVFAMGAVLVHAATGRGPFDSDSPYLVAYQVVHHEPNLNDVPEELRPVIERCLQKDPAKRPTTDALIAALRSAAYPTSEDTRAFIPAPRDPVGARSQQDTHRRSRIPVPEPVAEPSAPARRRPGRRVLLAGAAVLLAGAGVAAYLVTGAAGGEPAAPVVAHRTGPPAGGPWAVSLGTAGADNRTPVCTYGEPGAVYCKAPGLTAARLDPADGAVRWSVKAPGGAARAEADRAPAARAGLVYAVAPGGDALLALDAGTGARRWSVPVTGSATPLTAGKSVLLAASDGRVTALDAATGRLRWSKRLGGVGAQWLVAPDGATAFAVTAGEADGASTVTAFAADTGRQLWQRRVQGDLTPVGSAAGGLVLLRADRSALTDAVVRVDLRTAAVRRLPLRIPVDQAQAAVGADGTTYVIGALGGLIAVRTDGAAAGARAEAWRYETSVSHASRPVAAGGRVYLSAADGRLLAVDGRSGALLGQTRPRPGPGTASVLPTVPTPFVHGDRVYAGAPDGSVFAVDAREPGGW